MKKYFGFLTILALSLVVFTSCDREIEDDMEDMEELNSETTITRNLMSMGDTLAYPTEIDDYIAANYSDRTIDEVELDTDGNFIVTLDDDTELLFDTDGIFIEEVIDNEDEEDEEDTEVTEWPAAIDEYVAANYPDVAIDEVELNADGTYEVELTDDTELLFATDGAFIEELEDEDDTEVTEWPAAIDEYIAANHPDTAIDEVELNADGTYEVELTDGTELEFDADGNFIG